MSGRRAAIGVAFKNARRNKKRTLYLVLMIAIPVMVAVVTSATVRLGMVSEEERASYEFGSTNIRLYTQSLSPEAETWMNDQIERLDPGALQLSYRENWMSFSPSEFGNVLDVDLQDPLANGLLEIVDGSAPDSPGETAITEYVANLLGVGLGDSVDLGRGEKSGFEIVGILSHPVLFRVNSAVVSPAGFDRVYPAHFDQTELLAVADDSAFSQQIGMAWDESRYDFYPGDVEWPMPQELWFVPEELYPLLTDEQLAEAIRRAGTDGSTPGAAQEYVYSLFGGVGEPLPSMYAESRSDRLMWNSDNLASKGPVIGTGVAAMILAEVGFIAAAAFATGARRRLREIGLMSANGADAKHVRATVLGEGLFVGAVGGAAGSALAFMIMVFGRSLVQGFVERRIEEFPFSLLDVLGPVVVAIVACVIAAWLPSRTVSAVPTLTALQGRMPVSAPKRWVIPVGLVFTGVGALLLMVGLATQSNEGGAVAVMGTVLMIGGMAMLAGPLVAWMSRHAERFPVTPRIVLRDSGRQRGRAAAAVAATMVILMAPVAALATNAQYQAEEAADGLPAAHSQMIIEGGHGDNFEPVELSDIDLAGVQALLPAATVVKYTSLDIPLTFPGELEARRTGGVDDFGFRHWQAAIVNDDLLKLLDSPRVQEILEEDGVLLIGVEERTSSMEVDGVLLDVAELPIGVQRSAFPRVIMSDEFASRYPEAPSRTSAVVQVESTFWESLNPFGSPFQPLWDAELQLEMSGTGDNLTPQMLVGIIFAITILVVLIVVATITALSAAEGDRDLETIVAVGATNSIRRRFLGLQSGMHTLLGVVLSVPLTLLVMWTVYNSGTGYRRAGNFAVFDSSQLHIPWDWIAVLVIGLPLVIGLITLVSVRSAPTTPPRRAT